MRSSVTAVDLAVKAFGIRVTGTPATVAGHCVATGAPIEPGDLIKPLKVSSTFMDGRYLCTGAGVRPMMRAACEPFFRKSILGKTQKVILTERAGWPLYSAINRAWFILHPPEPPFAVLYSNTKTQHMIWKTPLTRDPDYWHLQLGPRTLPVRRRVVLAAREIVARMSDRHLAVHGRPLLHPWTDFIDSAMAKNDNGVISAAVRRFAAEIKMEEELDFIERLPAGDLWALAPLLFKGGGAEMPPPIDLHRKKTEEKEDPEDNL